MIIVSLKLLLTMCFGSLATSPNNITVTQTPTKIHLSVGEYTEITCVWDKSAYLRYRVSWYLVNRENITKTVSSKLCYVSNGTFESKDALVIKSANVNDTGIYYCEIIIEIPFCKKVSGNGTTLIVEEKEAHSLKKRDLAIWAVIPFLVAVGSLYLCYKKKQCSKHSGSAQLPVPAGRHQEEQMLETVEIHGRNEPTNEAAEENSSCNSVEWVLLKDLPEDPKSSTGLGNENRMIFAQSRITSEYRSSLLVHCIKRLSIQREQRDKAFWKYWS